MPKSPMGNGLLLVYMLHSLPIHRESALHSVYWLYWYVCEGVGMQANVHIEVSALGIFS